MLHAERQQEFGLPIRKFKKICFTCKTICLLVQHEYLPFGSNDNNINNNACLYSAYSEVDLSALQFLKHYMTYKSNTK